MAVLTAAILSFFDVCYEFFSSDSLLDYSFDILEIIVSKSS